MIDFKTNDKYRGYSSLYDGLDADLALFERDIKDNLSVAKNNKYLLGCLLLKIYVKKLYRLHANEYYKQTGYVCYGGQNTHSDVFFWYCFNTFGLDKSQVSRYMNIVDEFGDGDNGFKPEWQMYSYSQLIELLPLTSEQRNGVKPNWTVKQIREFKKVVSYSEAPTTSSSESPVATSQQTDRSLTWAKKYDTFNATKIFVPETVPGFDYDRYRSFDGMSPRGLCDMVLSLEEKVADLENRLEIMRTSPLFKPSHFSIVNSNAEVPNE